DIFATGILLWEMLASRRLFQGKTDYDTVKLVQKAEYTPISQLRPDVGEVLDGILRRALARDPAERYSTARELGHDLNRVLYSMARPVGAFDIADLVQLAMKSRTTTFEPTMSIIDKLIQETLFEFTSLQDKSEELQAGSPASGFELASFQGFGQDSDDSVPAGRPSELLIQSSLPAAVFEEGNLAALEGPDEDIPDSARSHPGEDWEAESSRPPREMGTSTVPARDSGPQMDSEAKEATLVSAGQLGKSGDVDEDLVVGRAAEKGHTMKSAVAGSNIRKAVNAARDAQQGPSAPPMSQRSGGADSAGNQGAVKLVLVLLIVAGIGAALVFSGAL
ncbi:MAG: hypothetical protein VB934_06355, partial [Polyangiaceae bacterium]